MNEAGGEKLNLILVILHANAFRKGVCRLSAVNSGAIKAPPESHKLACRHDGTVSAADIQFWLTWTYGTTAVALPRGKPATCPQRKYRRFRPLAPVVIGFVAIFIIANRREALRGLASTLAGEWASRYRHRPPFCRSSLSADRRSPRPNLMGPAPLSRVLC